MDKDISTLLQEVRAATGWSEPRIASELRNMSGSRISQPTVNRILNGQADCKASTLRAIVALHKRVCVDAVDRVNEQPRRRSSDKDSP